MEDASLLIGQTISHYRVIDQIGAGGMGVVYRARDEQLDRDVALKVLPVGTLADEEARKQFRKEALALAKLNHPNIETVHEFATANGMDFLAMELIPGSTLREKLMDGPLAEQDILRLAVQLSDGLTAAHEQGIVHRDLKPGNLIVTPDGRLKILDFGLAKLVQPGPGVDLTLSITLDSTKVSGTLPYMSPEQLRGLPVDPRSDIFAAGAVLYEMATGHRPFPQLHTAELMGAILHKTPEPPGSLNLGLPPGLESVIYKTLEKDPERRYHTARELKAALEGISASSHRILPSGQSKVPAVGTHELPPGKVPKYGIWAAGLGTVLLATVVLFVTNTYRIRERIFGHSSEISSPSVGTPPSFKARKSIAVVQFKNVSDRRDKDWQSTELAEMLKTELSAGEQLRTISGEDVAQAKTSLALPDTDSFAHETLQKLHKNLNADFIVLGTYIPLPDGQTRVDVRLQDAVLGTTLASISRKGNDLEALVTGLGAALREKMGVGSVTLTETAEAKAAMPSTSEARRLYSEGLAKLRAYENVAAHDLFQKAVLIEPGSAVIHSALAESYTALGYDEKARQSARNAFDLSSTLSREDRLLVEARYRETNKEWDHAIESYRTLFGFFPDNPEYGILLAGSQISAGKAKDALHTIEQLRGLNSTISEDPRIDLAAARALDSLGNVKESLNLSYTAAAKAMTNGSNLIRARALFMQAQELESLTQLDAAKAAAIESQSLHHAAGDRRGEQSTLEVQGNILADQGDLAGAIEKYKKQLAITREIGNRHAEASAMNNMALVLNQQNDVIQAREMWEQALVGFHDVSDKSNGAQVLINLAGISLDEGDLSAAKKMYIQTLEVFEEVNDQGGVATATAGIGTVLYALGDCAGAKTMLEKAIKIDLEGGRQSPAVDKLISLGDILRLQGDLLGAQKNYLESLTDARKNGDKSDVAYALFGLSKLAMYAGDFDAAHKKFDEALALRTELGEKRNVAVTEAGIASLALEEHNPGKAVALATSARDDLHKLRNQDDEITASIVLIYAFLAQGAIAEAERERASAFAEVRNSQSLPVKLDFAIASAYVDAAKGRDALAELRHSNAQAKKAGLTVYELESRLALAELVPRTARGGGGYSARLEKLQKDSNEKGYLLIAHKASGLEMNSAQQ